MDTQHGLFFYYFWRNSLRSQLGTFAERDIERKDWLEEGLITHMFTKIDLRKFRLVSFFFFFRKLNLINY